MLFTRLGTVMAVAALICSASCTFAAGALPKAKNANEAVVISLLDVAFNQKKIVEAFDKFVGPYYRQHNPSVPDGKEAIIKALPSYLAAVPDLRYHFKRVLSDGDLVVVHSHVTNNAQDRGMAVIDIFRVENGKVVEHWDVAQPVPEKAANDNTMF